MSSLEDEPETGWEEAYDFRIDEPSILQNKLLRMHWATRRKYARRWYCLVLDAIKHKPQSALQKAWVRVERGSYGIPPDPDGLVGGLKPLLDVMSKPRASKIYGLGLIEDDDPKHLLKLTAHSVRTRKGQGYTKVTIYRKAAYLVDRK